MSHEPHEDLLINFLKGVTKKLFEEEGDSGLFSITRSGVDFFSEETNIYQIEDKVQSIKTSEFTKQVAAALSDVFIGVISTEDINIIKVVFHNNSVFKINIVKL